MNAAVLTLILPQHSAINAFMFVWHDLYGSTQLTTTSSWSQVAASWVVPTLKCDHERSHVGFQQFATYTSCVSPEHSAVLRLLACISGAVTFIEQPVP